MIAIAAHKDESQRVRLRHIALEKDSLVVMAIRAIGLVRSRQRGIVRNRRRDRVQNVAHLLFLFVTIYKGLIRRGFCVAAVATGVLQ